MCVCGYFLRKHLYFLEKNSTFDETWVLFTKKWYFLEKMGLFPEKIGFFGEICIFGDNFWICLLWKMGIFWCQRNGDESQRSGAKVSQPRAVAAPALIKKTFEITVTAFSLCVSKLKWIHCGWRRGH